MIKSGFPLCHQSTHCDTCKRRYVDFKVSEYRVVLLKSLHLINNSSKFIIEENKTARD